ncbi:hypothetical protein Glove_213g46 [Diversispora epigaea]|uniref:Uncharacterized protein n=1 Tax=Diversispora epigaea TaxID=1348612 RepID=A0A397IL29_9GLOM|nr:hypothetical protein Glove_213g46 [Diversispora epigaea]
MHSSMIITKRLEINLMKRYWHPQRPTIYEISRFSSDLKVFVKIRDTSTILDIIVHRSTITDIFSGDHFDIKYIILCMLYLI